MAAFRIGVVGCGVIGNIHLQSCGRSSYGEAVAVADVNEAAAKKVAAEHGITRVYTDPEALIADPDVDGVVLALPANLRTPLALSALKQGKHVLIEKPISMSVDETRQLIAARGDRVAMCCENRYEFMPSTRAAARYVASGALGKLRLVRVRGILPPKRPPAENPPVWRLRRDLNAGGIMSNWGCYDLHYAMSVINWQLQPMHVLAQMWEAPAPFAEYAAKGSNAETHIAMFVQCADDAAITYERAEFIAGEPSLTWEVVGEQGTLKLNMLSPGRNEVIHFRRDPETHVAADVVWEDEEDQNSNHQGTIDAFARAGRDNDGSPKPLQQALYVQTLTEAAYRSATEHQPVAINLDATQAQLTPDELNDVLEVQIESAT